MRQRALSRQNIVSVSALQKYLWINHIDWQLIEGPEFIDVKTVLDNVMQEHTKASIGVVPKRAEVITYEFEEKMWNTGVLGKDTPGKLRDTVLFLLGCQPITSRSGRPLQFA